MHPLQKKKLNLDNKNLLKNMFPLPYVIYYPKHTILQTYKWHFYILVMDILNYFLMHIISKCFELQFVNLKN